MTLLFTPPPIRCSPMARTAFKSTAVPPTQEYGVEQHDVVELTQRVAQLAFEKAREAPHEKPKPLSLPRLEEFRPCLNIGIESPKLIERDLPFSSDASENIPGEDNQPDPNFSAPEGKSLHPFFLPSMIWIPLPRMHNLYPWSIPHPMSVPSEFNPFFHLRWESLPQTAWYRPVFMLMPFEPVSSLESPQQEKAALQGRYI